MTLAQHRAQPGGLVDTCELENVTCREDSSQEHAFQVFWEGPG